MSQERWLSPTERASVSAISLRHILASHGYAPRTIAVNVKWMKRGLNACQTNRNMHRTPTTPSNYPMYRRPTTADIHRSSNLSLSVCVSTRLWLYRALAAPNNTSKQLTLSSYILTSNVWAEYVSVQSLTTHSTHNRSFRGRSSFAGNQVRWYCQPSNNQIIHKTHKS